SVFQELDMNDDKKQALTDIRAKLDGITSKKQEDAREPTVTEISISSIPTISVTMYGKVPQRTLVQRAEDQKEALQAIPTVQIVTLSGSPDELLAVTIDLNRLEAYNLTAAQLFDALARNNMVVAGGTLDTGRGSFNVEVPGLISTAEDVYNLPLKTDG